MRNHSTTPPSPQGYSIRFYKERFRPEVQILPIYIPFLTIKVPFSYNTFYRLLYVDCGLFLKYKAQQEPIIYLIARRGISYNGFTF